jgi:hypothetical protein
MNNPGTKFLFTATGAFAIWLTKGFKGSFDNEMVSPYERNSTKGTRRYLLGMAIWFVLLIALAIVLNNRSLHSNLIPPALEMVRVCHAVSRERLFHFN